MPERISASEARRSFSKVLDEVVRGRRFRVLRHGREVCAIEPARATARRATDCLARLEGSSIRLDDSFEDDLLEILAEGAVEERPSWGS